MFLLGPKFFYEDLKVIIVKYKNWFFSKHIKLIQTIEIKLKIGIH